MGEFYRKKMEKEEREKRKDNAEAPFANGAQDKQGSRRNSDKRKKVEAFGRKSPPLNTKGGAPFDAQGQPSSSFVSSECKSVRLDGKRWRDTSKPSLTGVRAVARMRDHPGDPKNAHNRGESHDKSFALR
jgi:hypothetical protein